MVDARYNSLMLDSPCSPYNEIWWVHSPWTKMAWPLGSMQKTVRDSFKLGAWDIAVIYLFMLGHSCCGVHETWELTHEIIMCFYNCMQGDQLNSLKSHFFKILGWSHMNFPRQLNTPPPRTTVLLQRSRMQLKDCLISSRAVRPMTHCLDCQTPESTWNLWSACKV